MKLDVDFSNLIGVRNRMGAELVKHTKVRIDPTLMKIRNEGVEVSPEDFEITDDGILIHKATGKPILLYIKDQRNRYFHEDGLTNYKYHVSQCDTIKGFKDGGRLDRYVGAYRDKDSQKIQEFKINVFDGNDLVKEDIWMEMKVCKNCLKSLNYHGYDDSMRQEKKSIFENFDLVDFFKEYDTTQHDIVPKRNEDSAPNNYTPDWKEVSKNYRKGKGWTCEGCQVDLGEDRDMLHVHHINGVKSDNSPSNLKALCIDCHSNEHQHAQLKFHPDYKSFIKKYRD